MSNSDLVVLETDHRRLAAVLESLRRDANARLVFLLDKTGHQIACAGEMDGVDSTSLASLTAGNVAATDGLAQLLGEREFSILFHEGEHDNLHITVIDGLVILVVLFDLHSSVGLVRLRVQGATAELGSAVHEIATRPQAAREAALGGSPLQDLTDDDIDALFG